MNTDAEGEPCDRTSLSERSTWRCCVPRGGRCARCRRQAACSPATRPPGDAARGSSASHGIMLSSPNDTTTPGEGRGVGHVASGDYTGLLRSEKRQAFDLVGINTRYRWEFVFPAPNAYAATSRRGQSDRARSAHHGMPHGTASQEGTDLTVHETRRPAHAGRSRRLPMFPSTGKPVARGAGRVTMAFGQPS